MPTAENGGIVYPFSQSKARFFEQQFPPDHGGRLHQTFGHSPDLAIAGSW